MIVFTVLAAGLMPGAETAPDRQPQLAVRGDTVAMVFGRGNEILFERSGDGGATFSEPEVVGALPVIALGRHRGPRVAFAGSAILVLAIGGGARDQSDLHSWRSTDGGKSWSKALVVNDVPGSAREGLHALAADAGGHAAAVWLDLRAPGTRLYGAFSNDAGASWSKNQVVYESTGGTICQCCHPSLLALGGGQFAVMFRNVSSGVRDMYLARIQDGSVVSPAAKLGRGTWELNACPMDGGGLALSGSQILTAWRRDHDLFLATPGDADERIGTGKDVALAVSGGNPITVWNQDGRIEVRISNRTGQLSESGAFPVVAALPDGRALAAWEEGGRIATRRLSAATLTSAR
jgi:hypothetical protein